jgi:hypothetical protein
MDIEQPIVECVKSQVLSSLIVKGKDRPKGAKSKQKFQENQVAIIKLLKNSYTIQISRYKKSSMRLRAAS